MSAKLIASVVAGVCGTIFIGYCVYFDRKRRSDPLFKQKLRQSELNLFAVFGGVGELGADFVILHLK